MWEDLGAEAGITPAYAGKIETDKDGKKGEDHPRIRGENCTCAP